jgi:hypothetical protein
LNEAITEEELIAEMMVINDQKYDVYCNESYNSTFFHNTYLGVHVLLDTTPNGGYNTLCYGIQDNDMSSVVRPLSIAEVE